MRINLLTEDNLPYYQNVILREFGSEGAWGVWVKRWTAEEDRHAYGMRAYLEVVRGIDPDELEVARMTQMTTGYDDGGRDMMHTLAYVCFQENATQVSHSNTGKELDDKPGLELMKRIGKDEALHMVFYTSIMTEALEVAPNLAMRAITDEIKRFEMPGAGIPNFRRAAAEMAIGGIYDPRSHLDQVILPILNRRWKIFSRDDFTGDGAKARDELAVYLDGADIAATEFVEKRQKLRERRAKNART